MVPFVSETGPFCFQCFGFQLSLQIKKNQKIDLKKSIIRFSRKTKLCLGCIIIFGLHFMSLGIILSNVRPKKRKQFHRNRMTIIIRQMLFKLQAFYDICVWQESMIPDRDLWQIRIKRKVVDLFYTERCHPLSTTSNELVEIKRCHK